MIELLGNPGFDVDSLSIKDKIRLVRESDGLLSGLLKGAKVDGNLDLGDCPAHVPDNVMVGGGIYRD